MKHNEEGFTLIELMVVIVLAGLLMTLGAQAVRHFWLVRTLSGAQGEVVTQLRQVQQKVVSESHPLVYGARFRKGSDAWALIRYDPNGAGTGSATCREDGTRTLPGGVQVSTVLSETSFTASDPWTSTCRTQISGASGDDFVFFFARGSATAGKVTLTHPILGRSKTVAVAGITGRVSKQ